jgi:hypothetical protein
MIQQKIEDKRADGFIPGALRDSQMHKGSIYHTFRKDILPNIPINFFSKNFSEEFGRPTKDLQSIVGLFILQALRDMTDLEAIEAYSFNDTFRYALDISRSEYLSERSYYTTGKDFVRGSHHSTQVPDSITKRLQPRCRAQRTDSNHGPDHLPDDQLELYSTTIKKNPDRTQQAPQSSTVDRSVTARP